MSDECKALAHELRARCLDRRGSRGNDGRWFVPVRDDELDTILAAFSAINPAEHRAQGARAMQEAAAKVPEGLMGEPNFLPGTPDFQVCGYITTGIRALDADAIAREADDENT